MAIWTFYDYVSPFGTNEIADWYSKLTVEEQEVFNGFLETLAKMQKLEKPHVKKLKGDQNRGLFELIFTAGNKQHRVIGCYGPEGVRHGFTMLIGCTHKQRIYNPPNTFETATKRMEQIKSGFATTKEHEHL